MDTDPTPDSRVTLTVCVPMYKHAATIERCLSSVVTQDHEDFEILVVDDASGDGGPEIARSMLRPSDRVVVNEHRLGAAGNHNRCIELARGELVQFVHGDDEIRPGCLTTLAPRVTDEVSFVFTPRIVVTDDARYLELFGTLHSHFRHLSALNDGDDLVRQFVRRGAWGNWIGEPSNVMFRRAGALEVGGFRGDLPELSDIDLWVRMSTVGKVAFVDEPLSVRHYEPGNLSQYNRENNLAWLDHTRLLWSIAFSARMPSRTRLLALIWLIPCQGISIVEALLPGRTSRRKRLLSALRLPRDERARAQRR